MYRVVSTVALLFTVGLASSASANLQPLGII